MRTKIKLCNWISNVQKRIRLITTLFKITVLSIGFKKNYSAINITPDVFSSLIQKMSVSDGYYRYDNWITNERNYLNIIEPLKKNDIKGGAYVGVGPEQNFTFIETVKPDIAFIIDIRQQMTMQHLVYKTLFELAETRAKFFSLLFSKPILANNKPDNNADINEIVDFFYGISSDRKMLKKTTSKIMVLIENKFKVNLSKNDRKYIIRIMKSFCDDSLNITFDMNTKGYVCLAEILKSVDKKEEQLNFFNSEEKYSFIRNMQLENRIIPIRGDFAGAKALKSISDYLKKNNLFISAFYVSSVELWLFKANKFKPWVENIASLPINNKSVILRQILQKIDGRYGYKFRMQYIDDFLKSNNISGMIKYHDLLNLGYLN